MGGDDLGKASDDLAALASGQIGLSAFVARIGARLAAGEQPPEAIADDLRAALAGCTLDAEARDAVEDQIRLLLVAPAEAERSPTAAAGAGADDDRTHVVLPSRRPPQVGDVIKNRFVLEVLLGAGGMGTVFKALDRVRQEAQDRDPYVAIKVLSDAFRQHDISAIALQREAKKALSLSHPNIVRVYDFDKDGDLTFMTMEHLSGRSFDRIIRTPGFAGLPLTTVLEYMRPIADALGYAHSRGLVHSDFKPSNVFLTDDGQVKVIDFGIARAVHRAGASDQERTVFDPSALGALTLPYASPEQIAGLDPDPRDDIFAVACVTYELLTGRHPFGRKASATALAEGLAPARIDALPRRAWEALRQALAFEREARTPAIKAFVDGLAATAGGTGGRRRWLVALAAVLTLALAGGIGWETYKRGRDQELIPPPPPVQPPPPSNGLTSEALTALVQGVPCALIGGTIDGGSVQIFGVAEPQQLEALITRIKGFKGVLGIGTAVQPLSPRLCPVVDVMAPLVRSNQRGQFELMITAPAPGESVRAGGAVPVEIRGAMVPAYIAVDYFRPDETVAHLLPRPREQQEQRQPGRDIGTSDLDASGLTAVAGEGLLTVIATPSPLFAAPRPDREASATYLAALQDALARIARTDGAAAIAGDFATVSAEPAPN